MHLDTHLHTPLHDDRLGDPLGNELHWLSLLDALYALVEAEGDEVVLAGALDDWPAPWQPLVQRWALRIGARSIQIGSPWSLPSPRDEPGHLSHRRITGHVISACSVSPEGFTAAQAREFHVFCSHLHTAWSLRSTLDAAHASLASLHRVIDALPVGFVVLDEHGEVVLLNRQSREWLACTTRAGLQGRRLQLSAQHAAFEQALHTFMVDPLRPCAPLHLNGLDLQLKPLAGPNVGMLLLVHERCDPTRLHEIAAPPVQLAQQLQGRHALTDKELPLAWNVALGMPLKQYAALSGRSIETVRAQLKSVFRKLGVADQKRIGLILFEALHVVTLQALGEGLSTLMAERTATLPLTPQAVEQLPWR